MSSDLSLKAVHAVATEEAQLRRTMAAVFEPLVPLIRPQPPARPLFTERQLRDAWVGLKAVAPGLAEQARLAAGRQKRAGEPPPAFDLACARAANLVKDPQLARLLRVTHVLRAMQSRMAGWLRAPVGDNAAAIRLAFGDAVDLDEAIGPLFWQATMAMLDEPWQVLRLISASAERPSDRYMASSELSFVGERIMADIDRRLEMLKEFDGAGGAAAGAAIAKVTAVAVQEIAEFGQWIDLEPEGPWGERVAHQKASAVEVMETQIRAVEPHVGRALPTRSRGANKHVRPPPLLTEDLDPRLQARAEAYLALLRQSRAMASAAGFTVTRDRALEAVGQRIEQYCDDLVEILRRGENQTPQRVRAYLSIGADFYEQLKGEGSSQAYRRKAATA